MIGGIGDTGRHLDYNINMYTTDDIGDEIQLLMLLKD